MLMDRDVPRRKERTQKMGNEGRKRNQNRSRGDKRDIFADPSKSSSLCTIFAIIWATDQTFKRGQHLLSKEIYTKEE